MTRKIEMTLTTIVAFLCTVPMYIFGLPVYLLARHFVMVAEEDADVNEMAPSVVQAFVFRPFSTLKTIWTYKD